jgi:hypothetical protein
VTEEDEKQHPTIIKNGARPEPVVSELTTVAWTKDETAGLAEEPAVDNKGSILQNHISAENLSVKFSTSIFKFSTSIFWTRFHPKTTGSYDILGVKVTNTENCVARHEIRVSCK